MINEVINNIASIVDYLEKLICVLTIEKDSTREQDIAIAKLEEAVFWLTYGSEVTDVKD